MRVELKIPGLGSVAHADVNDYNAALNYAQLLWQFFSLNLLRQCGVEAEVIITGVPSKMNDKDFVIKEDQ